MPAVASAAGLWFDAHLVETQSRSDVALTQRWGTADTDGVGVDLQVRAIDRRRGIDEKRLGGVGGDEAVGDPVEHDASRMVSGATVPWKSRSMTVGSRSIPTRTAMSGPLGAGTVITSFPWTGTCDSAVSGPQWGPVRVNSAQRFSTPLTV